MADRTALVLLFPIAAPLIAWAAQGLLGWWIAAQACRDGRHEAPWLSHEAARLSLSGLTMLAIAVSIGAAAVAYRRWRAPSSAADPTVRELHAFLAFVGLIVAGVFALALVWAGLPPLLVRVCGETR